MAGARVVIPRGKTVRFRDPTTVASTKISSPEVGDVSFDTTSGLQECVSAGTWRSVGSAATGTLDAAYNGGQTITVDSTAVTLNASHATNDAFVISKSAGSGDLAQLDASGTHSGNYLVINADTGNGIPLSIAKSAGSGDGIDLTTSSSHTGIGLDLNFGAGNGVGMDIDKTAGSGAAVDIAVTGGTGRPLDLSTDQDIGVCTMTKTGAGAGAVLTIANSGTGNDITGTNFSVDENGLVTCVGVTSTGNLDITGDLTVSGTIAGTVSISGFTSNLTFTPPATTTVALDANCAAVTTGTCFRIQYDESNLTGAGRVFVIYGRDDTNNDFTIGEDGATVIAGTASGTDALTLTLGDLTLGAGNIVQSNGTASFSDTTGTTNQVLIDHVGGNLASGNYALKIDDGGNLASGAGLIGLVPTGTPSSGSAALKVVGAGKTIQGLNIDTDEATLSANVIHGGGATAAGTGVLEVKSDGNGAGTASAVLRVVQTGTPAAADAYLVDFDNSGATESSNPVAVHMKAGDSTASTLHVEAIGAIAADDGVVRITHGTGAIANDGAILRVEGTANAAGATAYGVLISANGTNLEGLHVEVGKSLFAEDATFTTGITIPDNGVINLGTAAADGVITCNGSSVFLTATNGFSIGDGTATNALTVSAAGVCTISGTGDLVLDDNVTLGLGTSSADGALFSNGSTICLTATNDINIGDGTATNAVNIDVAGLLTVAGTGQPTKSVFLPAGQFNVHTGTPAWGVVGDHGGYLFDGAAAEALATVWQVPYDWAGGNFSAYIYWSTVDTNSKDVMWRVTTVPLIEDEDCTTAGADDDVTDTAVSATASDLNKTAAITLALAEFAVGDMVGLQVVRRADQAGDTLDAVDATFYGIQISYAANTP